MKVSAVSICEKIIHGSFYALFFITPLLVCPVTYELFEFPKMLFVYVVTAIILATFLIKRIYTSYDIRNTPLTLPIILYSLFFTLSTLFSIHRYTSVFGYYSRFHGGLLSLICYILLFYIYIAEFRQKPKKILNTLYLILATSFLVSLYGILQHFGIDRGYWIQDSQARVFSTLGQPNWLAAWLLMILPLSWALYLSSKRLILNTCYLILATVWFAAFWFTYSLSGILGFVVASVAFVALSPRKLLRRKKKKILLLITVYCLLITVFPGLFAPRLRDVWGDLVATSQRLTNFSLLSPAALAAESLPPIPGGDTAQIRKIVWQGALDLWRSSPKNILLGTGPETFAYAFLAFRPAALNQTSEWDFLYNKAHNEYLDILCGTGILGLGAYLFLVGRFLWWGMMKVKSEKLKVKSYQIDGLDSRLILDTNYLLLPAVLSGWASLLITSFFGFSVVPTALLFWLYPAICFSFLKED